MMIQATVPSALGLFFTPWLFDSALVLSGAVTLLSILGMYLLLLRNRLTPRGGWRCSACSLPGVRRGTGVDPPRRGLKVHAACASRRGSGGNASAIATAHRPTADEPMNSQA